MSIQQLDKQQASLSSNIPSFVSSAISLADKNWFKTGGPARYFCEPSNPEGFRQALDFAHNHQLALTVLGEGANSLISDDGFDGLVIRPRLTSITRTFFSETHDLVEVGCGVSFQALIDWCLAQDLIGLEEFSGIPGTVGGSVFINIHYFEYLLSQFFVSGHVINKLTGALATVDASWFGFAYNHTILHEENHYLLKATFKLVKADPRQTAYAQGRRDEIIRHRHKRYPHSHTCGSFFRNFF